MLSIKWLWHLGAVTTAIYAVVFVVDFGLHFHEGWAIGARERDWVLDARRDCEVKAYSSALMQEECGRIRARPVAVPWHTAVHHVGRHLMAKLTSAIQSAFVLVCVLVPLALMVFYCAVRHQQQRERGYYAAAPGLRHRAGAGTGLAAYGDDTLRLGAALWETLRSAGAPSPPPPPGSGSTPRGSTPGSVVLDVPGPAARGKKRA